MKERVKKSTFNVEIFFRVRFFLPFTLLLSGQPNSFAFKIDAGITLMRKFLRINGVTSHKEENEGRALSRRDRFENLKIFTQFCFLKR